jgi:hypothetical protein
VKSTELVDDRVHVVQVRDHAVLHRLVDLAFQHLHAEAQARKRRAQVVGDAREEGGALALAAPQVLLHLVEGARHRPDLGGPVSATGGGVATAPELPGGARRARPAGGSADQTMRKVARTR